MSKKSRASFRFWQKNQFEILMILTVFECRFSQSHIYFTIFKLEKQNCDFFSNIVSSTRFIVARILFKFCTCFITIRRISKSIFSWLYQVLNFLTLRSSTNCRVILKIKFFSIRLIIFTNFVTELIILWDNVVTRTNFTKIINAVMSRKITSIEIWS